jgi:hypothetical protein
LPLVARIAPRTLDFSYSLCNEPFLVLLGIIPALSGNHNLDRWKIGMLETAMAAFASTRDNEEASAKKIGLQLSNLSRHSAIQS